MNQPSKLNKTRLIILLGILLIVTAGFIYLISTKKISSSAAVNPNAKFSLSTTNNTVNKGENFDVRVKINTGGTAAYSAMIKIDYDNTYLSVNDADGNAANGVQITQGANTVFPQWSSNSVVVKPGDSTKNTITLIGSWPPSGGSITTTTDLDFATISFKALAVKNPELISFQFALGDATKTSIISFADGSNILQSATGLSVVIQDIPPVMTLTANPTQLVINTTKVTLSWTVSGAVSCTSADDWTAASKSATGGTEQFGPLTTVKTYKFTLTCNNSAGTATTKSVNVIATQTPILNITYLLDARPSAPTITGAKLEVYTAGAIRGVATPILTKTGLNSDATGHFNNIDVTGLAIATNYDYYLFATPFVGIKKAVATDIFPLSLTFTATGQQLLGGDANGDGLIDDSDYAIFLLSDIRSDINGSGGIDANDVWWIKKNYTIN